LVEVWNSLIESSIMAYNGDSSPPWVEPRRVASESLPLGERLRPPKQSAMKSRLPKRMVSSPEKQPYVKCLLLAKMASADEGTIGKSRGKGHCKSPFLAHQLLVFSTPANYGVVKIMHSSS
jgi:hypothetical protein